MQYLVLFTNYDQRERPRVVVYHTVPVLYDTFPRDSNTDVYIPPYLAVAVAVLVSLYCQHSSLIFQQSCELYNLQKCNTIRGKATTTCSAVMVLGIMPLYFVDGTSRVVARGTGSRSIIIQAIKLLSLIDAK